MLWKIRCVTAWLFRILACAIGPLVLSFIVLGIMVTEGYSGFPMIATIAISFSPILVINFLIFEVLGSLFSWDDHICDTLPHFGDGMGMMGPMSMMSLTR